MLMTNRFRLIAAGATLALGAVACSPDDQLAVQNANAPDAGRALARPGDVENFIAGSYATFWQASMGGGNDNINNQMSSMSVENGSNLANFAMGPRSGIPRSPVLNSRGNSVATGNLKEYNGLSRAAAAAAVGLNRLQGTFTLGSAGADLRARSFGNFVMGISLGYQAMLYDSGSVVTSTLAPVNSYIPPIVGSDSVFKVAMLLLDSAITLANTPGAGFPTPATWIPGAFGAAGISAANFVRLIRSYKAKIRASMARNPTERTAVDWAAVLADAQNGIIADVQLTTNASTLFSISWPVQHYLYNTWHQMTPLIVGFADTSGAFQTWYTQFRATPGVGAYSPFLIATPDNRFPQGTTLDQQITASGTALPCAAVAIAGSTGPPVVVAVPACASSIQGPATVAGVSGGKPYMRARPSGENAWDGSWINSPYDFHRFRVWYNPTCSAGPACLSGLNRNGSYPLFTLAELNGLLAEAAIRLGNFPAAQVAINATRVPSGLPAVTAADLVTPVPGGTACVPKVPDGAGTLVCGNILEAMKWEKRIETMFVAYGAWFFDSRGWGDLPQGTSLQWPVPYQELDTRFKTAYDRPATDRAALGTYGY